jgi:hypothetical protein
MFEYIETLRADTYHKVEKILKEKGLLKWIPLWHSEGEYAPNTESKSNKQSTRHKVGFKQSNFFIGE